MRRLFAERSVESLNPYICCSDALHGTQGEFPGLLGLVNAYLNSLDVDFKSKRKLRKYLELVQMRANGMEHPLYADVFIDSVSGTLGTTATWMRNFIRSHPAYKKDSVVSQEINYDLLKAADEM